MRERRGAESTRARPNKRHDALHMETPPLLVRVVPVILVGWVVAAIRLTLDFVAPESFITKCVGVYYAVPLVLAYVGVKRKWGTIAWKPMALSVVVIAFAVWGVGNTVAYSVAQFQGWTHGRFDPEAALPLVEGTGARLLSGLGMGAMTSVFASGLLLIVGSLFIWVPQKSLRTS